MVMCFSPGCKHYSEQKICKFFRFPANEIEKKKWIELIRRERPPTSYSLVCSCHFVNGDRNNLPTLFEHNVKRKFTFISPEKRKRNVKTKTEGNTLVSDLRAALEEASLSEEVVTASKQQTSCTSISTDPTPSTSAGTSRAVSKLSGASVEAENYFLKEELANITQQLEYLKMSFSFKYIKNNDAQVLMYTGIPCADLFHTLYELMDGFKLIYYSGWTVTKIPKMDQLLLTLMKLRINMPHEDLAVRFNCSKSTITNVVMTWIHALHAVLFEQLTNIPTRRKNQTCLPSAFSDFTNCRIILDCTEVSTAVPKNMEKQRLTYSSYKHKNTWKALVGVAPNGVVTFVSKLYPGSLSDKKIVEHSQILQQMTAGDLIIADKGFLISDILPDGVHLNIPPFLSTLQFTEGQIMETKRIARARIHVERAIRRIKCYTILDRIPQYLSLHGTVVFQTCAALTNWQYPLIREVEEYFN